MRSHAVAQFMFVLPILLLTILSASGCGESAAEQKKKSDAELVSRYDAELAKEIEENRKDSERLKLRAEIEQHMRENRHTISELTLDSMARRSQFEGVVAEAILTLDEISDVDDQTKRLMDGSKEWYAAYRECESPGYIEFNGGIRHMPLKERIEKFTDNDELLGSVHALVDFIEQYRLTKDELAKEIATRATSLENPSDAYKSAYKNISSMAFEFAGSGEDKVEFDFINVSYEDLMAADERYPLFPKGSRFVDKQKQQEIEDKRLFGE